jgi:hypothetical protein
VGVDVQDGLARGGAERHTVHDDLWIAGAVASQLVAHLGQRLEGVDPLGLQQVPGGHRELTLVGAGSRTVRGRTPWLARPFTMALDVRENTGHVIIARPSEAAEVQQRRILTFWCA